MLALSVLFALLLVAARACHPECTYACDDPVCEAGSAIACNASQPACSVICSNPAHVSSCSAPDCWIECVVDQCEADACPLCATMCNSPVCSALGANCSLQCEQLQCGWIGVLPADCPEPQCELMCEQPACEVQQTDGYKIISAGKNGRCNVRPIQHFYVLWSCTLAVLGAVLGVPYVVVYIVDTKHPVSSAFAKASVAFAMAVVLFIAAALQLVPCVAYSWLIPTAILLCSFGDFLIEFSLSRWRTVASYLAFFVTQVLFVVTFAIYANPRSVGPTAAVAIGLLVAYSILARWALQAVKQLYFVVAVAVYAGVSIAGLWLATARIAAKNQLLSSQLLAFFGVVFFMASDTLLLINFRLKGGVATSRVIMITYWIALALIGASLYS